MSDISIYNSNELSQRMKERIDSNKESSALSSSVDAKDNFSKILSQSLESINSVERQADLAVRQTVAGRDKNIHETMYLLEKADLTFRLAMQVRNKIIEAYKEVMKIQI